MALHKLQVDDFYDDTYKLIAVHCALEDYRLAYLLNCYLGLNLKHRPGFGVVLYPQSLRLWLVGGYTSFKRENFWGLLKISLEPAPLKVLALEYATHNISSDDPKLGPEQLPVQLRREIESHTSGMGCEQNQ